MSNLTVGICTTVMNRFDDITKTLQVNINDNSNDPNVKFILLDYNSSDDLPNWINTNCKSEIDLGRLIYARTTQPQYYSMSHSRNLAFLIGGLNGCDVVNNVDADNYTKPGFSNKVRELALQNEHPLIIKSKRLMRGRLGMLFSDFTKIGGYNEELEGYGHDDKDLMERAIMAGLTSFYFGGEFIDRIKTDKQQKVANMRIKNWRETENANKEISARNLADGKIIANEGKKWGEGTLQINFDKTLSIYYSNGILDRRA